MKNQTSGLEAIERLTRKLPKAPNAKERSNLEAMLCNMCEHETRRVATMPAGAGRTAAEATLRTIQARLPSLTTAEASRAALHRSTGDGTHGSLPPHAAMQGRQDFVVWLGAAFFRSLHKFRAAWPLSLGSW